MERLGTPTIDGVTFSSTAPYFIVDRPSTGSPLYTGTGAILASISEPIIITATLPSGTTATAFGVDLLKDSIRPDGYYLSYLIGSSAGDLFSVTDPTFFGFTSDTPFSSVFIFREGLSPNSLPLPSGKRINTALDNFSFQVVPEPASIVGTLAFAALGGKKLLKRKQGKTA